MSGGRVVTLSAVNSSVAADPPTIADDGVESSTITVTVVNQDGNPMPNRAVTLAITSGSGTLTQPVGTTNQAGVITGSVVSVANGTMTISASTLGATVGTTSVFAGSAGSGSVSAVTDISRDAGTVSGGLAVTLTVADAEGTPTVLFGDTAATSVVVVNPTTITCVTPAVAAGVVGVSVAGVPLVNPRAAKIGGGFEFLPVPTTTFVVADFEGGTLPASLTASGTATVVTDDPYAGTYCLRTTRATTGGAYVRNTTNIDVASEANGVYVRFYQKMPSGTVTNLGDQIKTYLFRRQAGSGQPGWIMTGIGPDFPDGDAGATTFVSFIDNGVRNINGTPNQGRSGQVAGDWNEWIYWQSWDAGDSVGRCKTWLNGKLQFDVTSEFLGGAGTDYRLQLGVAYVQNPTGTVEVFLDEIFVANGFPDPVEA